MSKPPLKTWRDFTIVPHNELEYLGDQIEAAPPGYILVAGTYRGGDVMYFMERAPDRKIAVIDSFQGVADPTAADGKATHVRGEFSVGGLAAYHENFRACGMYAPYHIAADFITAKTLRFHLTLPIAFMWLDLDHYQPTIDCLQRFERDMVKGGVICVHNWNNPTTPGIKKALDEFGKPYDTFGYVARIQC